MMTEKIDRRAAAAPGAICATLLEAPPSGPATEQPLRLIRDPEVRRRTALSRSTIWRLEQAGNFPPRRKISARAIAWVESEVEQWIRSKGAPS
jgi:prophage regulatory protein